jgi:thioesterase domain-containing protein
MRKIQPRGPYLLGGTCEGAHIAFEMASQLNKANEKVTLLAMLDAWPLENTSSYFLHAYVHYYSKRIRSLLSRGMGGIPVAARRIAMGLRRRLARIFRLGNPERRKGREQQDFPTPLPLADDWKSRLWPGKDFVPPTFVGTITVFRVRKQAYWRVRDEQLGWGRWARDGVEVHVIPGRHDTILREPNVQVLAKLLDECLGRAQMNGSQNEKP